MQYSYQSPHHGQPEQITDIYGRYNGQFGAGFNPHEDNHKHLLTAKVLKTRGYGEKEEPNTSEAGWFASWKLQLASLLVSIICLAALIIVLIIFSGQNLSAWKSSFISINTIVAILSTIIHTSFLFSVADALAQTKWTWFSGNSNGPNKGQRLRDLSAIDSAARGGWGSFRLLIQFRHRLAWFGAFIMVLALGFDAVSQQIVSIENGHSYILTTGIPRVQSYNISDYDSAAWSAAKYDGIFGTFDNQVSDLPVQCASGNCTWPDTPSLSVCGQCVDISSQIIKACQGNNCTYSLPQTNYSLPDTYTPNGAEQAVYLGGLTLTNGPPPNVAQILNATNSLEAQAADEQRMMVFASGIGTGASLDLEPRTNFSYIGVGHGPFVLMSSISLHINDTGPTSNGSVEVSPGNAIAYVTFGEPVAIDCAITYCAATYTCSESQGVQEQGRKNTDLFMPAGTNSKLYPDSRTSGIQIANYSYDPLVPGYVFWGDGGYGPNGTINALQQQSFFDWSIYVYSNFTNPFDTTDVGGAIYKATSGANPLDSANEWISNYAKAYSNLVRQGSSTGNVTEFAGQQAYEQARIHVRWPWITFPVVMVLSSIIFLSASIIETERSHALAWKGSSLVLTFTDVDPQLRSMLGASSISDTGLDKAVGDRRVRLEQSADKWTFRSVP